MHEDAPPTAYVPAAHATQAVAPAALYWPAGQATGADVFVAQYDPAGHCVHTPDPSTE